MTRFTPQPIAGIHARFRLICLSTLAAALFGAGTPAQAGSLTTYFGIDQGNGTPPTTLVNSLAARNSFVGALTDVGVQNFESSTQNVFPSVFSFTPTAITATATTTNSTDNFVTSASTSGTFATSGTHFLFDNDGNLHDTLTFSAPVAGFGMYVTDLSDGVSPADQIQLVVTLADSTTQTFTTTVGTSNNNANVLFFGVISSDLTQAITGVQISNTQSSDGDDIGIDDVTIGQIPVSTPEPASVVLLATGALGLAAGFRRNRERLRTVQSAGK